MRVMRTTLATSAATALLLSAPLAAFAQERQDDDDYAAYGDPEGLAQHLIEAHDYTDVECVKIQPINEPTYTIDPEEYPDAIALRIQGNKDGKVLWLDPIVGKAYDAPSEREDDKINWVIVCTGAGGDGEDPGDPGDPGNPPIETDGPAQRPMDALLMFGAASLFVGVGAVAVGRRLNHSA